MPIIRNGDGTYVEYRIPEELQSKIPDYFYTAMAGELISVYGWEKSKDMFFSEEENECINLDSGTVLWAQAFKAACQKLNMSWLFQYYETLPWYDSDIFDGIIEDEICRKFIY